MLKDKTVLITGGTGSFGRKCVEVILSHHRPRKIIIFSRDEHKQADMAQSLCTGNGPVRFFIGDVRDRDRLKWAFKEVDVVIHAAAMKQVPASEYNPTESIRTNIAGSENVVSAAAECGVKKVIALSTDKAVNPINLYGATKLCAEKLFIAANAYVGLKKCMFSVVRYGNVIGSRGSVVPLFLKKRREGVLPVTHPEMTRFWITLSHGVEFVLQSLDRMTGGETFVPKLPSMKVMDLARAIGPECRIELVGIRQGEKIHETLINSDEARNTLEAGNFYVIKPDNTFFKCNMDQRGFKPVPEGFEYDSKTNDRWVSLSEAQALLASFQEDV